MALDDLCKTLNLTYGAKAARQVVAERIIELARGASVAPRFSEAQEKTRRHDATGGLLVFSRRDQAARCDWPVIFANDAATVRNAVSRPLAEFEEPSALVRRYRPALQRRRRLSSA